MIILQAQPLLQLPHYAVSAIVEPQSIPLRKVPILEQKDYELFAKIECSTQKMTKQDLMKAMGIGSDEGSSY